MLPSPFRRPVTGLGPVLALATCIAACSPTYDWRDVSDASGLRAQLPCKPDRGERSLPVPGRALRVHMMGCAVGDSTFAVAAIEVGASPSAKEAAKLWEAASTQTARATVRSRQERVPGGAGFGEQVDADGHTPGGETITTRALYFGRGAWVYQAIVIGSAPDAVVEQFFAGVSLR